MKKIVLILFMLFAITNIQASEDKHQYVYLTGGHSDKFGIDEIGGGYSDRRYFSKIHTPFWNKFNYGLDLAANVFFLEDDFGTDNIGIRFEPALKLGFEVLKGKINKLNISGFGGYSFGYMNDIKLKAPFYGIEIQYDLARHFAFGMKYTIYSGTYEKESESSGGSIELPEIKVSDEVESGDYDDTKVNFYIAYKF